MCTMIFPILFYVPFPVFLYIFAFFSPLLLSSGPVFSLNYCNYMSLLLCVVVCSMPTIWMKEGEGSLLRNSYWNLKQSEYSSSLALSSEHCEGRILPPYCFGIFGC